MVRLATLIPLPRHAIQSYHSVFAPTSYLRGEIVPAGAQAKAKDAEPVDLSPAAIPVRSSAHRRG